MSLQRIFNKDNISSIDHQVACDVELGRVRCVVLFRDDYALYQTLIDNLSSQTSQGEQQALEMFIDAVNNKDAFIISRTTGSYDGGSPQTGDGYGDLEVERILYYLHTLSFKDPSYKNNVEFWSVAEKSNWRICWRTDELLHFSDNPASISATNPIEEDMSSAIDWNVVAKWKSANKPQITPAGVIGKFMQGKWNQIPAWTVDEQGRLFTDDIVTNGQLLSSGVVTGLEGNRKLHKL